MCRRLAFQLLLAGWGFLPMASLQAMLDPLRYLKPPYRMGKLRPEGLTLCDIVMADGMCSREEFLPPHLQQYWLPGGNGRVISDALLRGELEVLDRREQNALLFN